MPFDLVFLEICRKETIREAPKSEAAKADITFPAVQASEAHGSAALPPGSNFSNFPNCG